MDEQSFRESLRSTPGDRKVLQQYADWLINCGDPRGSHLNAELAVYRAEDALEEAKSELADHRSSQTQHFDWLNQVFPLRTLAPASGTIYRSAAPGKPPFVEAGTMVGADTPIAIIESRKIFYQIPAAHGGLVTDVLFQDCANVEIGDCILRMIRPQRHQIPIPGK